MANNHTTLTSLFTDIADAIRVKTGGTDNIVADEFPDAIAGIDTQEDLDQELTTQDGLIAQIFTALEGKTGASSGIGTVSINIDVTAGSGYYINSESIITSLSSGTIDAVAGLCFVYNPGYSVRPFHPNGSWHDEAHVTTLGNCQFYQFTEDGSELQLSDEPM